MSITIIAPPPAAAPIATTQPTKPQAVSHVDPALKLISGVHCPCEERWHEEPLEAGLRMILVGSGQLRCRVPGQSEQLICGPSLCAIANEGDFTSAQLYDTGSPLRYTIIQLGIDAVAEQFGGLPKRLRPNSAGEPRIISGPAPRAMQALATQIATCQLYGSIRDIYLAGKAMELSALGIQFLSDQDQSHPLRINSGEIERIHAARDLLVDAMHEPPALDLLALRVGMNRRKLTAGFRKVFGASVFEYLQEHRLREAHRMLCDEEVNVSTVAYRVGYSPAHFAIAFRKRYGVSPSAVR